MTTREAKKYISVPKGYRRLRLGEIIPDNFIVFYKTFYTDRHVLVNQLIPKELCIKHGGYLTGWRLTKSDSTIIFIPKI